MITVAEAAKMLGLSKRRVQELCRQGRVPGARLVAKRVWVLPSAPLVKPGTRGPRPSYIQ